MSDTHAAVSLIESAATGLRYRRFGVKREAPARARLLLLHGVGGNETNLEGLAAQLDARVETLLVRGPLTFAPGQFGWFEVSFATGVPAIDPLQAESSRERLVALLRELRAADGANPLPTVIAGFSQGGILSASVGLTSPEAVKGFAILSGRILPEIAPQIASTEALKALTAFIAHGRYDNKLPIDWAERADRWLDQLGVRHETHRYDIGHEIDARVVADFTQWLAGSLALDRG
ncbi:carboxylesterase [Pandoraea terrae]|uniref:Carboxylesterase n=1 Tax=Pandoraea terrae TaxID=1537710 RepID=A0A5E4Z4A6_9BURK|nr:phospholipase [Pandoraea terrae]VVE55956.1 carboxylesterase [Pandoraea terrae]